MLRALKFWALGKKILPYANGTYPMLRALKFWALGKKKSSLC
jgi:hypothetical protein